MSAIKEAMDATESKSVAEGQVLNNRDVDIAAAYADRLDGENAYTSKEAARLRWKLDLRLVPILWLNVTLSAMDKVTTSTAALYGLRTATNLTGNRYSWVGSAFYVRSTANDPLHNHLIFVSSLAILCGLCLLVASSRNCQLPKLWLLFKLCGD